MPVAHTFVTESITLSPRLSLVVVFCALSLPAVAKSKDHFHRVDARQRALAEAYLASHGHADVTVRAFRDRLVLGGALPSGEALAALEREIARASGAASVHTN
ncbi:MAG: hypothetical protein L6Q99_16580 [Planctomycetes bacterium]|nr:hypothetical protein [Planctomycetota bacterium]